MMERRLHPLVTSLLHHWDTLQWKLFISFFLVCTFMIFCLPNLSSFYEREVARKAIPYLLPLLQTCLTISVYATVAIAINGYLYVRPAASASSSHAPCSSVIYWLKEKGMSGTSLGIITVILFGIVFNISRWFEMETVDVTVIDERNNTNRTVTLLQNTDLRKNALYIQYYGLIGSCIIMVFVPVVILVVACSSLHSAIPAGTQKHRTLRIMIIIIVMFMTCHMPKVILTGYEIAYHSGESSASVATWSTWARVLKELSHVLLVSYSALNPIAYCGDLVFRNCVLKLVRKTMKLCSWGNSTQSQGQSEFEMMKSVGITLNGADPIPQQLMELDAQSRLLSGLSAKAPPQQITTNHWVMSSQSSTSSQSSSSKVRTSKLGSVKNNNLPATVV